MRLCDKIVKYRLLKPHISYIAPKDPCGYI
jgi:hypothetical protein